MYRSIAASILALALASPNLPSQAPMEDVLWVASRGSKTLTKYSRFGQLLQTVNLSNTPRRVHRAPDGKLWVLEFASMNFSIHDRQGKQLKRIAAKNSGRPYALAFDKRGHAFMTNTTSNTVDEYKPDGTFVRSVVVPSSPLGIAIDYSVATNMGNLWIAHRTSPGQLTKIPIKTFKPVTFKLPSTATMMPTAVVCTYEGIAKDSKIFIGGDRSDKLWMADQAGKFTGPIATTTGYNYCAGLAIDRKNRLWTVGSSGVAVVLDTATHSLLKTFKGAPANNSCGGLVMDSIGRPWIMDRGISVPGTFRRYDDQGVMELGTPAGSNTYGMVDAAGFAYAYVVNPFGDEDKDGMINFVEITSGTSPYDPLSNLVLSFDTRGVSRVGRTPFLDAISQAKGAMVVLFSAGTGPGLTVPGFKGQFLLDLTTLFYSVAMQSPGQLPLPIPANPALVGISYQVQGLFVGATVQFTNTSGIFISK